MDEKAMTTVEDWQEYERMKKELPLLSPGDYEAAIKGVCELLSV